MATSPSPDPRRSSRKFRFKHNGDHRTSQKSNDGGRPSKRHHAHHRSKRRKTSSAADDPGRFPHGLSDLDPDTAFRESLYDALGDDEGAQYWQGVYGQPIHNYPNSFPNPDTGELETMTDEEYANFVRRKMWEKSWEGLEAAKEEKRKQRAQEKEEAKRNTKEQAKHNTFYKREPSNDSHIDFEREIDASLRRGTRRKETQRWRSIWGAYSLAWKHLKSLEEKRKAADQNQQVQLKDYIAWPVESGKREDVSAENIQRFVNEVVKAIEQNEETNMSMISLIKVERVKWHPDKIQQKYGFMAPDDDTMQGVTAVFQILDQIWNDSKSNK